MREQEKERGGKVVSSYLISLFCGLRDCDTSRARSVRPFVCPPCPWTLFHLNHNLNISHFRLHCISLC